MHTGLVCGPTKTGVAASGGQTILITSYDWPAIERYVRGVVEGIDGTTWRDVAMELDRVLGRWEFADYKP